MLYITFPNTKEAELLGNSLMDKKLIACFNLMPAHSNYFWEGKMCQEDEIIMIAKSLVHLNEALETTISKLHSYDTPCILSWEANANQAYFKWVQSQVLT